MKTKNKKMSIIIIGICAVLLCVFGVSLYYFNKKDNNNKPYYYLHINEDLVNESYYLGEELSMSSQINIATIRSKPKENKKTARAFDLTDRIIEFVNNSDLIITGFDTTEYGQKAITFSYKGFSTELTIYVKECAINTAVIENETNLFVGEKVDSLKLLIYYEDGHTVLRNVKLDNPLDTTSAGAKILTFNYCDKEIIWRYNVYEFNEDYLSANSFLKDFPIGFYYKLNASTPITYNDGTTTFTRNFQASGEFLCESVGEKTIYLKFNKSDIFNNPNDTSQINIGVSYTVYDIAEFTVESANWFGIDEIPKTVTIKQTLTNGKKFNNIDIPISFKEEDLTIGNHSIIVEYLGKTATYEYSVVDIVSVSTEQNNLFLLGENKKVSEKYSLKEEKSTSKEENSSSQPIGEIVRKYTSNGRDFDLIKDYDYSGLEFNNEIVLNPDLQYNLDPSIYSFKYYIPIINYYPIIKPGFDIIDSFDITNILYLTNKNFRFTFIYGNYEDTIALKVKYSNNETLTKRVQYIGEYDFSQKIIDCSTVGEKQLNLNYYGKPLTYSYTVKDVQSIKLAEDVKVYSQTIMNSVAIDFVSADGVVDTIMLDPKPLIVFENESRIILSLDMPEKPLFLNISKVKVAKIEPTRSLTFMLTEEKYTDIEMSFDVYYTDGTIEENVYIMIGEIDTTKIGEFTLTFNYCGYKYSFPYEVQTIKIAEESKTIYQYQEYKDIKYYYYNGSTPLEDIKLYTYSSRENIIDTSTVGTQTITVEINGYSITFECNVLPLNDCYIVCRNDGARTEAYCLGEEVQIKIDVYNSDDIKLYSIALDEYIDTSTVSENCEYIIDFHGMTYTFNYRVFDIQEVRITGKNIYYVGEKFKDITLSISTKVTVGNDGQILNSGYKTNIGYTKTIKLEDFGFDITQSEIGLNTITFDYYGYLIDFVYYYGEKGSVELQENTFVIERTEENTISSLYIPMLITIGDYQFVDNDRVSIYIKDKEAGTYTYKFMYDDQEFEITYTIVDAE